MGFSSSSKVGPENDGIISFQSERKPKFLTHICPSKGVSVRIYARKVQKVKLSPNRVCGALKNLINDPRGCSNGYPFPGVDPQKMSKKLSSKECQNMYMKQVEHVPDSMTTPGRSSPLLISMPLISRSSYDLPPTTVSTLSCSAANLSSQSQTQYNKSQISTQKISNTEYIIQSFYYFFQRMVVSPFQLFWAK